MNTVKLGTLKNIAIKALALNEFNRYELADEIESQDYMCMNPDFEDAIELAEAIIKHKNKELDWEYEWDQDGFYYVWSKIDGKTSLFEIARLVSEEFGEESNPLYERITKFFGTLKNYNFIAWKL